MYPAYIAEGQDNDATEVVMQEGGQTARAVIKPKCLTKDVEVADIGCGFGGLLMALAPVIPDTLCLGTSRPSIPAVVRQPANQSRSRDQSPSHGLR